MRMTLLAFLVFNLIGGCTTGRDGSTGALERHAPLPGVLVSLPAGFKQVTAQGIDSDFARIESRDAVVTLDRGTQGAQVSPSHGLSSFNAVTGQTFDRARVSNAMEGFASGILMVERRPQIVRNGGQVDPSRLSIGVYCQEETRCNEVAEAIATSLRLE